MITEANNESSELSEEGYQRLEALLEAHCEMNLEMMDGFFAALLAGPRGEAPGDYIPIVVGQGKTYDTAFPSVEIAKEFIQLALHHWNSVAELLANGSLFAPMLKDELEEADGHDWATGFIKGVKVHAADWKAFLGDGSTPGPMAAIFALHYQYDKDPEIKLQDEPFTSEQTQQLIAAAAAGVMGIKKHFSRKKKMVVHENTITRQGPKPGRNDPCPCGSGKKYKKCCGAS